MQEEQGSPASQAVEVGENNFHPGTLKRGDDYLYLVDEAGNVSAPAYAGQIY